MNAPFSHRPEREVEGLRLLESASARAMLALRARPFTDLPTVTVPQLWWHLCPQPMRGTEHWRNLLRSLWPLCALQLMVQDGAAGQSGEGRSPEVKSTVQHVMVPAGLAALTWTVAAPSGRVLPAMASSFSGPMVPMLL